MISVQKSNIKDAKKVFLKKGSCSHTFFYLLNREFGHFHPDEEKGSDIFAGGIMQLGYQCGMLWGASMAVGAESYRRCKDLSKSTDIAVRATQIIMNSFIRTTKSPNCSDITNTDFSSKFQFVKYMIFKAHSCFSLAKKWANDAVEAAIEGLSHSPVESESIKVSCASELIRKIGGNDEQIAMVAGFAGGLGLSGNACGALGAIMWFNTMKWVNENPGKETYPNPIAKNTLEAFYQATGYEIQCCDITDRKFNSLTEHTAFICNGGCGKLLNIFAELK